MSFRDFGNRVVVTVGALVFDRRGRLLLVKHGEEKKGGYWYGKWIPPGGRLEPGETLTEGAAREIREETGLEVELYGKPIVLDRIVRDGLAVKLHVVYVSYLCRLSAGSPVAQSDVSVAKWFCWDEIVRSRSELHEDARRLLAQSYLHV